MNALRQQLHEVMQVEARHHVLLGRLLLILAATLAIDVVASILMFTLEHSARGTDIHTLGQSLFFTTVQLLTVSSQMRNPVTPLGRVLDVILELWAVIVVAGSAGAITAFFQTGDG